MQPTEFFVYLVEAAVCQATFYLLYRSFFRKLGFFRINRFVLLSGILLSMLIPALHIPVLHAPSNLIRQTLSSMNPPAATSTLSTPSPHSTAHSRSLPLEIIYAMGALYFMIRLCHSLYLLASYVRTLPSEKQQDLPIIHVHSGPAFFSFWRYIFINRKQLVSDSELDQIILHERAHLEEGHTFDNLFMELVRVIWWFNPFVYWTIREIRLVHEYLADSRVIRHSYDATEYARLMLRLSCQQKTGILSHEFSKSNLKNRILMLQTPKTSRGKLLSYLMIIPLLAFLLAAFSFTNKVVQRSHFPATDSKMVIGQINWNGNSLYSDEQLTQALGIRAGDSFDESALQARISYRPDGTDISSMYMDHGYMYSTINMEKQVTKNVVNLTFEIFEGDAVTVDQILITGNHTISTDRILKMIPLKNGEPFSRKQIIQGMQNLSESGLFQKDNILLTPIPKPGSPALLDLQYQVTEL